MIVAAPLRFRLRFRPRRHVRAWLLAFPWLAGACANEEQPVAASAGPRTGTAKALAACEAGVELLVRGETGKAQVEFARARELDPLLAEAHFYTGQLEVQLSGRVVDSTDMSFARRNLEVLERGIAALTRAVELAPERAEFVETLGRAYHQADDLVNARRWLERAVELDPAGSTAWKRLGMVYLALPETALAKAAFERSLELEPKDANSAFHLGQVLEVQRDFAGARVAYERAIQNNPTQHEFYGKLIAVLERLGDAAGADAAQARLEHWRNYDAKVQRRQRVVDKAPRDAAALRRLGEVYLEGERWKSATDWCTKAVLVDPKDAQAHLCCAIARRELEEYAAAEKHLREAEYHAPDLLDTQIEFVRLYAATGDAGALGAVVAKVEAKAAADGATLFDLGTVCREVGREAEAARLLGKAQALGVTAPALEPGSNSGAPPGER